jgi:TonB-dependent starch-binding outer membrane protein SusC
MRNLSPRFVGITKHFLLLSLIFFSSISVFAQKTVTGTVKDNTRGTGLAGATVAVKGTNVATSTDVNGAFSIAVPAGSSVLTVSYVDFESQDIDISGKSQVDVSLAAATSTLNVVVVTGYSSQRKKDITGAVAVVNANDLKSIPAIDAGSQLQGRASGVTVTQNGVPGAPSTVRIRGLGSFNNNNPLYVVDGVQTGSITNLNPNDIESMQVLKDAASASIYGVRASNGVIVVTTKKGRKRGVNINYDMYYGVQNPGKGIDLLNAQEEAELYFLARRNSGLPTTGSVFGNGTSPVLPDYIFYTGAPAGIPIMNGNPGVDPSKYELNYSKLGDPAGYSPYIIVPTSKTGTDWYDVTTRSAPMQNHSLSLSGTNDNSRYFLSMNYFNQDAITYHQFYKRYTARMNSEFNLWKTVRVGENLQVSSSESNVPPGGSDPTRAGDPNSTNNTNNFNPNNTEASVIAQTYRPMAIVPVYTIRHGDFAGNAGGPGAGTWGNAKNPLSLLYRNRENRDNFINIFGNVYAEIDFLQHFTARSSFGGSISNETAWRFPFIEYEYVENQGNTTYNEGTKRLQNWIWTNQVNYRNSFGQHDIAALIGTEAQKFSGRAIIGSATGFFNYSNFDFINLGNGAVQNLSGSNPFTPVSTVSYFAKADYAFDGKYLVSAIIRRDGSSKFLDPNKYGNFPAFSLGWRMSDETFMKNVAWVNDLKIRGSWGKMGNELPVLPGNAFTSFQSNRQSSWYDMFGTQNAPQEGFFLSFLGNNIGQWEKSVSSNIGFDATLFNNSTEIVFDWYKKKTEDLLFNPEQQAIAGGAASQAFRNVGSMENKGIDLQITHRRNLNKDIRFNGTLTFTTYKNEITSIAPGLKFFDWNSPANEANRVGGNATRNLLGNPLNTFFGYKVIGIFQNAAEVAAAPTQDQAAPGRFKYEDINGDKVIDSDDRTIIGNANPDFTYGINLGTEYKAWDLTLFFYGAAGKDAFNFTRWWTDFTPGDFPGGRSKRALYDSWLPDGSRPDAKTPIQDVSSGNGFSTHKQVNSYYVENASYFRLRNLQLGYNLPASVLNKVKLSRVRIYLQATNLFTITKYTGLNPDIISSDDRSVGIDAGAFPTVKQYFIGANVSF